MLRKIEITKSQKSLADELSLSVGKVNYVIKALIEKGL
ncbi:winged helix-turn-helix transcriptional regulator, partial [Sulfurimonas sp. NWX79]